MLSEDTKILEFNQYQKSDKILFIIYARCEYKNNPKISAKVGEHIPSGVSMSTIFSINNVENKHDVYRDKDYLRKFCESLGRSDTIKTCR